MKFSSNWLPDAFDKRNRATALIFSLFDVASA